MRLLFLRVGVRCSLLRVVAVCTVQCVGYCHITKIQFCYLEDPFCDRGVAAMRRENLLIVALVASTWRRSGEVICTDF